MTAARRWLEPDVPATGRRFRTPHVRVVEQVADDGPGKGVDRPARRRPPPLRRAGDAAQARVFLGILTAELAELRILMAVDGAGEPAGDTEFSHRVAEIRRLITSIENRFGQAP